MFEVGQKYKFTMIEDEAGDRGEVTSWQTVLQVEGNLIRIGTGAGADTIVNTGSIHFVRAEPVNE